MSVLRRAKLRTPDGTESIEYPLGVDAENVEVANGENLSQRLVRIDEDLEKNEEDIAAVSELAGTNKQNIGANEIRIDALERRSASVDKKPYYFNTVADMKAYQELKAGDMAVTLGYYESNDGGGATYKITNTQSNSEYQEELDNGLYATLTIKNGEICFNQIGGKADDNTFDNSTILVKGLNLINNSKLCLLFTGKNYYFSTPISDITLHGCRLASNVSSALTYTGTGWFITFTTTNDALIDNLRFFGNSANKGINFGDVNAYRTMMRNVQTNNFTYSVYIGRAAYFYIDKCNFYAKDTNVTLLELGKEVGRQANELIIINDSIFAGGESLTATGDFIRINQVSTLRITNTDFANTLGRWIYFNNSSTGNFYDIQINGCTFTRAKNGIVFDLTSSQYIENLIFNKPLFDLYGKWSDGETNVITVNRTGVGYIENSIFRDVSIKQINNDYSPNHFIYDSSNSTKAFVNFLRRPNVTNYSNSGVININQIYTITPESSVTLSEFSHTQNKVNNMCTIAGSIFNSTGSSIAAYSNLGSGFVTPLNNYSTAIIGITEDGTCYPFFIENGHLKCRKAIPASVGIRVHCVYAPKE